MVITTRSGELGDCGLLGVNFAALAPPLGSVPTGMPAEEVPLTAGLGRILAEDVTARLTQPPVAVSAMDGYAVRAVDVATVPARLTVIGMVLLRANGTPTYMHSVVVDDHDMPS